MIINSGPPRLNGLYVVYTDDERLKDWGDEHLRTWQDGRWRDGDNSFEILGWIGPLPAFKRGETVIVEQKQDKEWDL